MLIASHDNGLAWVASSHLHLPLLLWRLMRMKNADNGSDNDDEEEDEDASSSSNKEMMTSQ